MNTTKDGKRRRQFFLDEKVDAKLRRYCADTDQPVSTVIVEALLDYLRQKKIITERQHYHLKP